MRRLVAALLVAVAMAPALAAADAEFDRRVLEARRVMAPGQVLQRLRAEHPGALVSMRIRDSGGVPVYEMRVRTLGGGIGVFLYDAKTAAPVRADQFPL